jgi:hypothetical protein
MVMLMVGTRNSNANWGRAAEDKSNSQCFLPRTNETLEAIASEMILMTVCT